MKYINQNFVPAVDQKIVQKMQENLEKLNRTKMIKAQMQQKQIMNRDKGKSFLQESAKFGREVMEKIGYTRNFGYLPKEIGGITNSIMWKMDQEEKENRNETKPPKKRKTFKYTFIKNGHKGSLESDDENTTRPENRRSRRGREEDSGEEDSNEESGNENEDSSNRARLRIGGTQEVPWPNDVEGFYQTQDFLEKLQNRDRFIQNNNNARLGALRFKSEEGRPYKNKSDFIVDTIREKINFIKRCCK